MKRRIKKDIVASSTEDLAPSKAVSFGTETGQWDRLTASRLRSKWANKEGAPHFASPKPDDSLVTAFDQVKAKHKQSWSTLDATMSAGASAHAILSAESFIRCFLKSLPKDFEDLEEFQAWKEEVKESFKKNALAPISDASSCLAAVVNSSVKEIRRLVIDSPAARNLKTCLKEAPPSSDSFFGNPTERINSAISNSFMLSSMAGNRNSSAKFAATSRKFMTSKPAYKPRANSSGFSAFRNKKPQFQGKKPGNDSRRGGRGGRSGQM